MFLGNVISEPVVDDMVFLLAHCLELAQREYNLYVFKLCSFCLGHICPVLPSVGLGYPMGGVETVDLSSVIEPLHCYLLSGELTDNFVTDPESIARCLTLMDNFRDQTFQAGYDQWESVNFHGRADIVQELSKSYKNVPVASDVDTRSKQLCKFQEN